MKNLLFLLLFLPQIIYATTIANCQNPEGHAYFPYAGMSPENMAGWDKDKITNGIVQLVQDEEGKFDIQFVDASKLIISAKADGATIIPFARNKNIISVAAIYAGTVLETYTFIKDLSGKNEFLMTQTKVNTGFPKAGVMRGTCTFLDLSALKVAKE